jgi:putrescine aminotransferase
MTTSHFWHGFTDMSMVKDAEPMHLVRGEGAYLWDIQGRRYLDASASLWNCNIGHGRVELAEAARKQMAQLETYSTFGNYTNTPIEILSDRIAALAPFPDAAVFYTSGGSDTTDTAIKLVRRYWEVQGQPQRRTIISRSSAYHGCHMGSTALGGIALDREGYGELITDTAQIPWDSAEELAATIDRLGAENVAAFICEPIIAAGGCLFPPAGYLQQVERICRENGVLLILDEVVTGFGRAGDWFAAHRFGITPDMIICAKGLTSGYLPLGALVVAPRVSTVFYDGTAGPWYHGYTSSGHATAAAVALTTLDIVEKEGLIDNVLSLEKKLPLLLAPLAQHRDVAEVRIGQGLLAAIELTIEARSIDPGRPKVVAAAMRGAGVLTRSLVNGELQFSPPLTVGIEQVEEFVAAALTGLDETAEPAPRTTAREAQVAR